MQSGLLWVLGVALVVSVGCKRDDVHVTLAPANHVSGRYQGLAVEQNLVVVDTHTGDAWAWGPALRSGQRAQQCDSDKGWVKFPEGPWGASSRASNDVSTVRGSSQRVLAERE